jgi:hypothetical protein
MHVTVVGDVQGDRANPMPSAQQVFHSLLLVPYYSWWDCSLNPGLVVCVAACQLGICQALHSVPWPCARGLLHPAITYALESAFTPDKPVNKSKVKFTAYRTISRVACPGRTPVASAWNIGVLQTKPNPATAYHRKHSHRRHHQNTGSITRDEVFVPTVQPPGTKSHPLQVRGVIG